MPISDPRRFPIPTTTTRLAAALTLLGTAAAAHAQTRVVYVDQSAPAGGTGSDWQHAFRSLSDAIVLVNAMQFPLDGVELRLAQGTYRPPITARLDRPGFELVPTTTASGIVISIQGGYAGLRGPIPDARDFALTRTVLTADVLGNDNGSTTTKADNLMCALSIYGNRTAVWVRGLEFTGASLANNSSGGYGVLSAANLSARGAIIEDCYFHDNEGSNGGALYLGGGGNSEVRRCRFIRNSARQSGGALAGWGVDATDCVFEGNTAGTYGGAISIDSWSGTLIMRCVFRGNHAGTYGGAVSGGGTFESCLFDGNDAVSSGGAAYMIWGATYRYCTFVHNLARWGGGIFAQNNGGYNSNAVHSCILWGNSASESGSQLAAPAPFPAIYSTIIQDGLAGMALAFDVPPYVLGRDIFTFDPQFADPEGPDNNPATYADNNLHLSPRSPARDLGTNNSVSLLDLDMHPRAVSGISGNDPTPDLGCYESQVTLCPADITADGGVTVDDFIAFIEAYAAGAWLADVTTDGTSPTPDGAVTIDDLLYFLARFQSGC